MSTRYDNDSEDVVKENTKQTEAINKYIIGTLKIYITPEIFVKNTSGDTKKRKMPSIYYTRQYTKTLGEVQKIQKEITNEQAASKLPSGSGASGTSGITTGTGTGMGQQMQQRQMQQQQQQQQEQMQQQQQQQEQMQRQQQQQMQRPQQQMQQLVRQPVKVMGGGAEPMYGMIVFLSFTFLVCRPNNAFSTFIGWLFASLIVIGLPSFFKNPLNALRLKKVSTWLFNVE